MLYLNLKGGDIMKRPYVGKSSQDQSNQKNETVDEMLARINREGVKRDKNQGVPAYKTLKDAVRKG